MGTPVYQAAHGFRRGDAVRKDSATQKWVAATGAWDAVVSSVSDRARFEVMTDGILEDLLDLTVGATQLTAGGTAIYRALTETTALLLPAAQATTASSAAGTGTAAPTVNNVTNVTNVTQVTAPAADDTVAIRRSWMGV